MSHVTFYLLDSDELQNGLKLYEALACDIAVTEWRKGLKVVIACASCQQAHRLDDVLWHRYQKQFIPHTLVDDTANHCSQIILGWPKKLINLSSYNLLISLLLSITTFSIKFQQIIDFVPLSEFLKQKARKRYQSYQEAGFHITTVKYPHNIK